MKREAHQTLLQTLGKNRMTKRITFSGLIGKDGFGYTRTTRPAPKADSKGTILFLNIWRFPTERIREDWMLIASELWNCARIRYFGKWGTGGPGSCWASCF